MKAGDLIKIFCTCGEAHDAEPMIGVIVEIDEDMEMVKVMMNNRQAWIRNEGLELVNESR